MFKCLSPGLLGISASPNELIEPALSNGFKALELDIVAFAAQVAADGLPTARRLVDSAKLRMGYFRLPVELADDDAAFEKGLQALAGQAKLAAEMGCTRCVAQLAAGDERPIHQNFDFHRPRIQAAAKQLEEFGIQLGIGFMATVDADARGEFEFIRTFEALQMLLAIVGTKNVGVSVDLYELWSCESSFAAVQKSRFPITAVFLADVAADVVPCDALQSQRLLPGEVGTIDSVAVLTALAEAGYDGPVVPAAHPERFKQTGRQQIFKLAAEKLDQVWKAAGLSPAGKLAANKLSTAKR